MISPEMLGTVTIASSSPSSALVTSPSRWRMRKLMLANRWAATLRFKASEAGAAAVELAIIFPFLLMVTFGIIEFGFVLYQMNMAEKATQFGVRKAVTWDPVAPELATYAGTGAA